MIHDLENAGCDLYALADSAEDGADSLQRALQSILEPSCHPDSIPEETPTHLSAAIYHLRKAASLLKKYLFQQKYNV